MSVRITSAENVVALFDSASGFAFGPTFADEDEAEGFREFAEEQSQGDIRNLTDAELSSLHAAFQERA